MMCRRDGPTAASLAVNPGIVALVYRARRRAQDDAKCRRDGVGHPKEADVECPELDALAVLDLTQLLRANPVLCDLSLDEAERELARVDGHLWLEVHEQVRKRTSMVLVPVGDDDTAQLVLVLEHIGVVRKDQVYAELLVIGKHEAGIHEYHVVFVLEYRHVLAYAVQTTKRNDSEWCLSFCHACCFLSSYVHICIPRLAR